MCKHLTSSANFEHSVHRGLNVELVLAGVKFTSTLIKFDILH